MNFFHHKDLGNHLLQLCPKVVKHPVYTAQYIQYFRDYRILAYKEEEIRPRVLEKRLLGRILVEKKEDLTEAMRKLHN